VKNNDGGRDTVPGDADSGRIPNDSESTRVTKSPRHLFYAIALMLVAGMAQATIVRMEFVLGTSNPRNVYVELFDDTAKTKANFLNYIDDGNGNRRYDGTFVHRKDDFVVQGGGYVYDPDLGDFGPDSVTHIPTDAVVDNEPYLHSNVRGTLAMAKQEGVASSATSEWFFNREDNLYLDTDNSGYTVFGRVLGDGMSVIDAIGGLRVVNQGPPFNSLPLSDFFLLSTPPYKYNLVYLNTVEIDPPAHLEILPEDVDFDLVDPALAPVTQDITIRNLGSTPLELGQVGGLDTLDAPFAFTADNCSGVTLDALASPPDDACTITVSFTPPAGGGPFGDTFDIPSNDPDQPSLTYEVKGVGQADTPTLNIVQGTDIEFNTVGLNFYTNRRATVRNIGPGTLTPTVGTVTGPNADSIVIYEDNCVGQTLELGETCIVQMQLTGNEQGLLTASLPISAEPGAQSVVVNFSGLVRESLAEIALPEDTPLDAGDAGVGFSTTVQFPITNVGAELLYISGYDFDGADYLDFAVVDNDCVAQEILASGFCVETITFTPTTPGTKTANLNVYSNDVNTPVATLPVFATASGDNDGVRDSVEDAGPNGGDGNNDAIPDSMQSNVTSLPDLYGEYVTLVAPPGIDLRSVQALDNPTPSNPVVAVGGVVMFPVGYFGFTLNNVPIGTSVDVTLQLPPDMEVNNYLKFGRQNGGPTPGWYLFDFINGTGAQLFPDRVVLHLQDGGRGDDDGVADGVIVDPGGPALILSTDDGSSGGCTLVAGAATGRHRLDGWLVLAALFWMRRWRRPVWLNVNRGIHSGRSPL
jgi:cyclophilin family peptidyl-prolyl cis-trans isomerase